MGIFSDFQAKRADKFATKEFEHLHAVWEEDKATLAKLVTVFTAVSNGENSVPNTLMQKSGELTLWSATGTFHEVGKTPTRYVGRSSGVSIPVVAGIRFRVGAMEGTAVPGVELQMDKDQGVVMLTTHRLIFTGPIKTQEWDFDKLLMLSTSPDQADYFISVSNREKTSGVRFDASTGKEFNRFLGVATSAHESGLPAVIKELHELEKRIVIEEPKLNLPSGQSSPQ